MKLNLLYLALALMTLLAGTVSAQVTVPMPGRSLIKLVPDYLRPLVYALNPADGSAPGTLLALNATNGALVREIFINRNPTDMAMSLAGDALYVIHAGSRTIAKVDLTAFGVVADKLISTPHAYNDTTTLHLVVGRSNWVYFTDGGWVPNITLFDYFNGTNVAVYDDGNGIGGLAISRNGQILYGWRQDSGNVNSWLTRFDAITQVNLTPLETSFGSQRLAPIDTPIFLDGAERWVFNKQQMFAATNVSVLLSQFADNIYGISWDGSIAFGPTQVFDSGSGATLTNLPFSTTIQCLSGDQKQLFRYDPSTTNLVIYDMAGIARVAGPDIEPTPASGSMVSLPWSNLTWTVSPLALGYDVYLGTNQVQVTGAKPTSAAYLGRVTSPGQPLSQALLPGNNYYWRVDTVDYNATHTGTVWSFTTFPLSVTPAQIAIRAIAGYSPPRITLNLAGADGIAWMGAVTGSNWLTLEPASGTSPSGAVLTFASAALPAGAYTNTLEFTVGAWKLEVPVTLEVKAPNIVKMAADRERPYIYALQAPPLSGQNGWLLFINASTANIDRMLPIGSNPTDLSINYGEGRLYVASWTEARTYVVDLTTQTLLPALSLGTDVYKLNAGRPGRLIIEGEDQNVAVSVIDTTNGSSVASAIFREGDGEFDPTGRYYYHSDYNLGGAGITKFDLIADSLSTVVAGATGHVYDGSRNIVMSQDGSRLFWTTAMYDADLADLGVIGAEIYACSTNGAVAFGGNQAFDTATRRAVYNLPTSSGVCAVDGRNQRFWYFDSATATLGHIPMSVVELPHITEQTATTRSVKVGDRVYMTITVTGMAPLSYQWTLSGTNLPDATNAFLSITNFQPAQQGDYRVIVSNPFGSVFGDVVPIGGGGAFVSFQTKPPEELGQTLNGFQDDFNGPTRDPNWVAVGPGGDCYFQTNGVLQVYASKGDPNHLLYMGPGASNNVQEVLVRIRVVNFGNTDFARAGIGLGVNTNVPARDTNWGGINLLFRNLFYEDRPAPAQHFKLLDDLRAWGPPAPAIPWNLYKWYWMRLRFDPTDPTSTNAVFGKVWAAYGEAEPADWQLTWPKATLKAPARAGYAGIAACSGWLGYFEVDYILIKSASLPLITVQFDPLGTPINPPRFITLGPPLNPPAYLTVRKGTPWSVFLNWFGPGEIQWSTSAEGPYGTVPNIPQPWNVVLPSPDATDPGAGPVRFFRLVQPPP